MVERELFLKLVELTYYVTLKPVLLNTFPILELQLFLDNWIIVLGQSCFKLAKVAIALNIDRSPSQAQAAVDDYSEILKEYAENCRRRYSPKKSLRSKSLINLRTTDAL